MLDGEDGRRLGLHSLRASGDGFVDYVATLELPDGRASVRVYDYDSGLAAYVRSVAGAWQGFDDATDYTSLEGQLALSCRHDGLGTVECQVTLRQPWPPTWSLQAALIFGVGAHLDRIAASIEAFFRST